MCCSFTSPLIVQIPGSDELKSKPTQHSVKELLSIGIQPDILVCRSDTPSPRRFAGKSASFAMWTPLCHPGFHRATGASRPRFPPFPASTRMIFFRRRVSTGKHSRKKEPSRLRLSGGTPLPAYPGIIRTASLKEHPEQQSPQNFQTGMNDFPSQPRSRCRKSWRLRTTTILP